MWDIHVRQWVAELSINGLERTCTQWATALLSLSSTPHVSNPVSEWLCLTRASHERITFFALLIRVSQTLNVGLVQIVHLGRIYPDIVMGSFLDNRPQWQTIFLLYGLKLVVIQLRRLDGGLLHWDPSSIPGNFRWGTGSWTRLLMTVFI